MLNFDTKGLLTTKTNIITNLSELKEQLVDAILSDTRLQNFEKYDLLFEKPKACFKWKSDETMDQWVFCNQDQKPKEIDWVTFIYYDKWVVQFIRNTQLPPAIEIIEYCRHKTFSNKNSYIFPMLYDTQITKLNIHNRHVKMLTIINKQLKEIAEKCKIDSELTTYVARQTYTTVMKKSAHSFGVISESMEYSRESFTKIYLEDYANSFLDEANKSIL